MTAHPKRKISRTRGRMRRANQFLTPPTIVDCQNCSEPKLLHHVCQYCGHYRGEKVMAAKED